jgi:hypothetical protein
MIRKLSAFVMLFCTLTYATAGTTSIGTASVRGDMRVDGYAVKGDATLFDGTVVETGQASAVLRLDKGVEIKLATGSRGTLHRDRLVLQQGSSAWTGSSSFQLEANGLQVTPSEPNSRGVVSMSDANTVEVAALTGGFRVTNNRGLLLASVHPGDALSFGAQQPGVPNTPGVVPMTLYGTLTKANGHYYLLLPTPDLGISYELTGANLEALVGKGIIITGTCDTQVKAAGGGARYVINVATAKENAGPHAPLVVKKPLLVTLIAGSAGALGWAIYEAVQPSTPASR